MQSTKSRFFLVLILIINTQFFLKATDPIDEITKDINELISVINRTNSELNNAEKIIYAIFSKNWELTNSVITERTSYVYLAKATIVVSFCAFSSYQLFYLIKFFLIRYYKKNTKVNNQPYDEEPLLEEL